MGQKVARTLGEYHQQHVTPLEERLAWLELPWYKKLRDYAKRWWAWFLTPKLEEGETSTEIDHTPPERTTVAAPRDAPPVA
jgi:hypothetical protein